MAMKKIFCLLCLLVTVGTYAQLYVPNAFSPNGDNVNDIWYAVADDTLTHYEVQIFNSNGELVFRTNDINDAWLGGLEYYNNINVYPYKIVYKQQGDRFYQVIYGCVKMIR